MELEDPYEARLFQMFKSCDKNSTGLLDEKGLYQLCGLLELQDKGQIVIADLLNKKTENDVGITYDLFKIALLNFLGGSTDPDTQGTWQHSTLMKNDNEQRTLVINDNTTKLSTESPPDSSDREVTPKLVMGNKKYGRRSRPQLHYSDELSLSGSDDEPYNEIMINESRKNTKTVERSSSQTDLQQSNRRRRTLEQSGTKLKRCASLPAQNQTPSGHHISRPKMLAKHKSTKIALQKFEQKQNENFTQQQLSSSVESLGHETLSSTIRETWNSYSAEIGSSYLTCTQLRIVCERLGLQTVLAERVAVESFDQLHTCQYNQLITVEDFIKVLTGKSTFTTVQSANLTSHEIFDSNKIQSKEPPTHMESLPVQSIIDIWERSSIPNGKNILLALGFDDNEICLSHLYKVIEEEVRSLEDEQQMTLLRASLALQSTELSSVRQVLRQVHDENVKLRSDNKEANQRVALMALEIDERHALLEENARKEVKTLEQRHAAAIRELTARMANDREQWSNLTAKLEARIKTFEQNEIRFKADADSVRKENEELENEQQSLQKQITELLEQNIKLNRDIAELTEMSQGIDTDRLNRSVDSIGDQVTTEDEVLQLVDKLATLQVENHKLRDKNDELAAEVENLNLELQRHKTEIKKRSSTASMTTNSTLAENEVCTLDEMESGSVPVATKRRGDSPSKTHITEESPRTGKLRKCGNDKNLNGNESDQISGDYVALNTEMQQPENDNPNDVIFKLRCRVDELEALLKTQQQPNSLQSETAQNSNISTKDDHAQILARCKELETSLEQMRAAYEDCEDYWQSKLEEERQHFDKQRLIYDEDQAESDKKFTELMEKVREYEEQFNKDGRLSPIDEKDFLEQQYVELETELKSERENAQRVIESKSKETENLRKEIETLNNEIENLHVRLGEIVTDACEFSNQVVSHHNNQEGSAASSPINYLWHQSTIQQPAKLLDKSNATAGTSSSNRHINCINLSTTELSTFSTPPNTLSTSSTSQQACISPIQKPVSKNSQIETDDNGLAGDCDTTSTSSGKSLDGQSASTSTQNGERPAVVVAQSQNAISSNDERRCATPSSLRDELKRLKFLEVSLKDQIKDLSFQRDGLVMELQQLQEARPVLEKAYARTAHPSLTQRISQLELKNRHLQNVIKQQQQYSESIMQQSWRQYQTEMNDLHGRLDAQVAMITEQGQRLQNADMLVKDLYVENAHLTATVQRLEQQRFRINMMHQQQQQQQMHQLQGLNVLPSLP